MTDNYDQDTNDRVNRMIETSPYQGAKGFERAREERQARNVAVKETKAPTSGGGKKKGGGGGGGWALAEAAMLAGGKSTALSLKAAEILATHLMFASLKDVDLKAVATLGQLQIESANLANQVGIENPLTIFSSMPKVVGAALGILSRKKSNNSGTEIDAKDVESVNKLAAKESLAFSLALKAAFEDKSVEERGVLCDQLLEAISNSPLLQRRVKNGSTLAENGFLDAAKEMIAEIREQGMSSPMIGTLYAFASKQLGDDKFRLKRDYDESLGNTAKKVASHFQEASQQGLEAMTKALGVGQGKNA